MQDNFEMVLRRWQRDTIEVLPAIILAIVIVILSYLLARFIRESSFRLYYKLFKKESKNKDLISFIIYAFSLSAGIFLALEIVGLEGFLTKLLAGAGIIGIIAGFAFKDIASNAFAGLFLHAQRPFQEGDWVKINDHYGAIEKLGTINTSLKTIEGQEVFVPNQMIYNTTFINFSTFQQRLIVMSAGVTYGDDLEHVKKVAIDEVKKIDSLIPGTPVEFFFTSIRNSAFNFDIRFWIHFNHQRDFLIAMDELIIRIKRRFDQENITIAYHVTTLDFDIKKGKSLQDQLNSKL